MVKRRLPSIPDQLEPVLFQLEQLISDMRMPERRDHGARLEELEERAQAIAYDIIAPFRGHVRRVAQPLHIERDGDRTRAIF